ncbi:417_t:CDS:2, partial [Dentiscutata erythropus]
CKVDSKAYKDCCYKKRIIKSNNKIKDDEFYNYFLIKMLNISQNNPPNVDKFQKIHDQILSTFELELLRDGGFWITKIDNSQFTNEEKLNLHKICEEHIRILLEQLQQSDYQRIQNSILKETNITNLEVDRYWFRKINRSSLSENQQKELNDLRAKTLITLSNKQYDEIRKEILETNNSFLLEDREDIDRRIRLLKDDNLTDEKQTIKLQEMCRGRLQDLLQVKEISNYDRLEHLLYTYVRRQRVELLSNESILTESINDLNQHSETNRETLANEERYNLIIQSLVESVLEPPRTIQILQNLRQELYNKITQSSYRIKKIKNLKEAFDWLIDLLEKKEKIYNLFNEIIINYIMEYPNGKYTNKLQEEKYFNNEIDKIDKKTCDVDMFNENITDFIDKTIKKNVIYKLIKEIYQESGVAWVRKISKKVKDTHDE